MNKHKPNHPHSFSGRRLVLLWAFFCAAPTFAQTEMSNRSPEALIRLVADRQIHPLKAGEYRRGDWETVSASLPPEGVQWNYPWGVTLYGLLRTGDVLNDTAAVSFVLEHNRIAADQYAYLRWQKDRFGRTVNEGGLHELMVLDRLDFCGAMASQVLEGILRHRGDVTPETDSLIRVVVEYISTIQSRLPDGTLWRPLADQAVWSDDLYMSCPFLIRYAEYVKDDSTLDDAARQILNMASLVQDRDGVWFHAYIVSDSAVSGFKWCRANGWAMVAAAEWLSAAPRNHPQFKAVKSVLKKHIDGIVRLQALSGRWHQVLDYPDLWEETSSTAMFLYCICRAVNRGWIDPGYLDTAHRAFRGLNQKITKDGALLDVCQGTGIGRDLEFYKSRKRPIDDGHGQGAVLLALTEYFTATRRQSGYQKPGIDSP
jgi:unsaturated rhamnogalacturonyl hydrolase